MEFHGQEYSIPPGGTQLTGSLDKRPSGVLSLRPNKKEVPVAHRFLVKNVLSGEWTRSNMKKEYCKALLAVGLTAWPRIIKAVSSPREEAAMSRTEYYSALTVGLAAWPFLIAIGAYEDVAARLRGERR